MKLNTQRTRLEDAAESFLYRKDYKTALFYYEKIINNLKLYPAKEGNISDKHIKEHIEECKSNLNRGTIISHSDDIYDF